MFYKAETHGNWYYCHEIFQMRAFRPTYGYSILSVALVILLIGAFGFALMQARSLVTYFKEKIEMLVEIHPECTPDQREILMASIANKEWYKEGSVKYISKEEGAKLLHEDFGTDFQSLGFENPLLDVIQFNLKANFIESASLERIKFALKKNAYVNDVYYQNGIISGISDQLNRIALISLAIAILFLIVAITLIHNTIRLALHHQRNIIQNMQLVGASWRFITRPFLWQSLKNGTIAAMIAVSVLLAIILLATREMPELNNWDNSESFLLLFAGMFLTALLINFVSTWYVVRKYLDLRQIS